VWHILTKGEADCHAMPERLARKLLQHAYRLGRENRQGQSTATYVRAQLDQLGVGADLTAVRWDKKRVVPLPPSSLKEPAKN
jgi:hypothetical protein